MLPVLDTKHLRALRSRKYILADEPHHSSHQIESGKELKAPGGGGGVRFPVKRLTSREDSRRMGVSWTKRVAMASKFRHLLRTRKLSGFLRPITYFRGGSTCRFLPRISACVCVYNHSEGGLRCSGTVPWCWSMPVWIYVPGACPTSGKAGPPVCCWVQTSV